MTFDTSAFSRIFQCKQCGDCCKGYGGTYVTPSDIEAIAGQLNTDPGLFVEKYCQMSGGKPVLAQGESGHCIFWDKLCTIHRVKPRMCREWPFIKPVLADIANWEIMAGSCPGIRTDAPDDIIKACVKKIIADRE
jgi:uncharacterized protein